MPTPLKPLNDIQAECELGRMARSRRCVTVRAERQRGRIMKIWSVFVVAAITAVIIGSASAASQAPSTHSYIVTFTDDVADPGAVAAEHARAHQAQVSFVYRNALKGYAATVTDRGLSAIARDRRVANVERDGIASIVDTQNGATWGLDRIDQQKLPLSTTYTAGATGAGVTAYIIDTGIR